MPTRPDYPTRLTNAEAFRAYAGTHPDTPDGKFKSRVDDGIFDSILAGTVTFNPATGTIGLTPLGHVMAAERLGIRPN